MKRCYDCKKVKALSEFTNHAGRKDGKQTHCKSCAKAHQTKWYYKRKYGITLEERDALLANQNGLCKICRSDTEFAPVGAGRMNNTDTFAVVDHCHTTNKIRGILCGKCNTGLGAFRDSEDALLNAIQYLK